MSWPMSDRVEMVCTSFRYEDVPGGEKGGREREGEKGGRGREGERERGREGERERRGRGREGKRERKRNVE